MADGRFPLQSGHDPAAVPLSAAAGITCFAIGLLALMGCGTVTAAQTNPAPSQGRIELPPAKVEARAPIRVGGAPASGPCVKIDIAGNKAGDVDCAAAALDAAAKAAQARAANAPDPGVPSATSADIVTGVASRTATRQRMGNRFGKGVRPQRPSQPAPPGGGKP
ncbi:hypothetical protein [Sphingomonas sp.]|uniref:hypothetical protein n=1 Tax=Sphingomonas sp. TaxID=28214 RepID=UPI003D6CEB52